MALTTQQIVQDWWQLSGAEAASLPAFHLTGDAEQLPSRYQVGALASASIAAQALAAQQIFAERGGAQQTVTLDQRHALAVFRSERYLRLNGGMPPEPWSPVSGYYQAADQRWLQLHTNFPHHLQGVLQYLGCADSRDAVAAAIREHTASDLTEALSERGLCASLIRTPAEWQSHPQAAAIAAQLLFHMQRSGDAPPRPWTAAARPLQGVRVLDLSRVIAAPVAARTLVQHGADVMAVGAAHLPNIPALVMDTGRGKRNTQLDLRDAAQLAQFHQLLSQADVLIQAYRPGALAAFGLSEQMLAERYPGLIQLSLSAYGQQGPWATRRGYDSLVQSATGIACTEGSGDPLQMPGKLPCQALDHATGYLAAFAVMRALQRRAEEGGNWQIQVSLAQTGAYLTRLGVSEHITGRELSEAESAGWLQQEDSGFGQLTTLRPAESMPACPPYTVLPAMPAGSHPPVWW